jgi:hypothetical protein
MEGQNAGNLTVAPEIRRHRDDELSRIQIRQIAQTQRSPMAVHAFDFLVLPVSGPQCPENQIGPIGRRKKTQPMNTAMLSDPVPRVNMVGMCVFGESCWLGLLGCEKALLLRRSLEESARGLQVRLCHNTILVS